MPTDLPYHRRALLYALFAGLIVFVVWNIPQLSLLLMPFRLFVTLIHEIGHGLAAVLTGGHWLSLTVNADGSGVAMTSGGVRALILPAGYLGAALFGAVLFYVANRIPYPRIICAALGVCVIAVSILYGGIFSIATIFGVVVGFALFAIGLRGAEHLALLTLNLLAILTGLNAVLDLTSLVGFAGMSMGGLRNDALAFHQEIAPLIPAPVIALVWALMAIALVAFAVYQSVLRSWRSRDDL